jgi:uncharacterized protein (DUF58 family)
MSIKKLITKLERTGKIYILPTKYGIYFLFFVFTLFLFSLTYGHSMAFTATFIFVCILMTSAAVTNFNLKHINIKFPAHGALIVAGEDSSLPVSVSSHVERGGIWLSGMQNNSFDFKHSVPVEIPSRDSVNLTLRFSALKRGIFQLEQWYLHTSYPMGLFAAWRPVRAALRLRVIPTPVDFKVMPQFIDENLMNQEQSKLIENKNDEDFYEYSTHQEGDSWKLLDWKVLAKTDAYLKKKFSSEQKHGRYFFDYDCMKELSHEDRLSQLVYWIMLARDLNTDFVINLPGHGLQYFDQNSSIDNLWDQICVCETVP